MMQVTIGGPNPGYVDGSFHLARFRSPQGLAFRPPSSLYVADTGNHTIRLVNNYYYQCIIKQSKDKWRAFRMT